MTLTSALVWRAIMPNNTLFPTPLPAMIPIRCPRPMVMKPSIARTPVASGESIRMFHRHWSRRALRGGPVVLLISDGWDRGDPLMLRDQIARLQRSCHRLVWLNPLIGSVDYAPLTRGLQAALPFVDDFLPVRTLRDVRDLALHLGALHHHGHHRHLHLRRPSRKSLDADDGSRRHRVVHPGM